MLAYCVVDMYFSLGCTSLQRFRFLVAFVESLPHTFGLSEGSGLVLVASVSIDTAARLQRLKIGRRNEPVDVGAKHTAIAA